MPNTGHNSAHYWMSIETKRCGQAGQANGPAHGQVTTMNSPAEIEVSETYGVPLPVRTNGQDQKQKILNAGLETLNKIETFLSRFVAYPSEYARIAHVLWIAHTHLMNAWENTARIAFLSPEPASGKTRALE